MKRPLPSPDRRCRGTKANGEPCRAFKLYDSEYCFSHDAPTAAKAELHKAISKANGNYSKPKPRALDLLRDELEANADAVVAELMDTALNAMRAVVVSGTKDSPGTVEMVADHDARLKAIRELYDRGYGKAAQSLKVSGDGSEPIRVDLPKSEDRAKRVADILKRQGAIGGYDDAPHEGRRRSGAGQATNVNGHSS